MTSALAAAVVLSASTFVASEVVFTELRLSEEVIASSGGGQGVTTTVNPTHYGDPTKGCKLDEIPIKIQGIRGGLCTAHCSTMGACPTDVPAGSDAVPRCALENHATGDKFCALMCSQGMSCGEGASCKIVQGNLGVCTYDDVYYKKLRGDVMV